MVANRASTESSALTTEYRQLHVRPWVRFFARSMDIYLFQVIICTIFALVYPALLFNILGILIITFGWFLIEPFFLSQFGTTAGKFLLNVTVRDKNGALPSLKDAYIRTFWVLCKGLGFQIPIVSLFTLFFSYKRLNNTGTTAWDEGRFIVSHSKIGFLRILIFIIILFILGHLFNLEMKKYLDDREQTTQKSPESYAEEVELQNKQLPKMVNDEMELSKMHFENDTLTYEFKLVDKDVNTINPSMLHDYMSNIIMKSACNKATPDPTLSLGYNMVFNYSDKNGKFITKVLVKPTDCK